MFKGKKMAGHMGQTRVTTQNLEVVSHRCRSRPDPDQGAVPGSKGAWILVRDAVKVALPANAPRPAAVRKAAAAAQGRRGIMDLKVTTLDGAACRQGHADRRDLRSRAARRHPRAHGPLPARQAPPGTHKVKNRAEIAPHRHQDVQAEGYGPRPSPFGTRSAVPRRWPALRPGRPRAMRMTCRRRSARWP